MWWKNTDGYPFHREAWGCGFDIIFYVVIGVLFLFGLLVVSINEVRHQDRGTFEYGVNK